MTELVPFTSLDQSMVQGALGLPAGDQPAPGVILLQEWWGINDHIRSLVERMAQAGFVTMAPDLYRGKCTRSAEEAGKLMTTLDTERALADIAGAARYLLAQARVSGKVGLMGFCMGGALSFRAAARVPEFAAIVPFYGAPAPDSLDWKMVRAPIMTHFATRDGWAKPEIAQEIGRRLNSLGKSFELHLYDADHAFVNDTRKEVYHHENAKLAWDRTVEYFRKHLS